MRNATAHPWPTETSPSLAHASVQLCQLAETSQNFCAGIGGGSVTSFQGGLAFPCEPFACHLTCWQGQTGVPTLHCREHDRCTQVHWHPRVQYHNLAQLLLLLRAAQLSLLAAWLPFVSLASRIKLCGNAR